MLLDCFFRNVTDAEMDQIYEDQRYAFVNRPVTLNLDNGVATVQLGFHVKIYSESYSDLADSYPTNFYLYQDLPANFRINDKFPMHVFGPGNGIDTAIDPTSDDQAQWCRFKQGEQYADSYDGTKTYKIQPGQGLVEMEQ